MRFLPLGLDLHDTDCLVIGGGDVGTRKVRTLADAGARVRVIAPEVTPELAAEIRDGRARWIEAAFAPEHLDGARLVIIATDDPATNDLAARLTREHGALLCDATSGQRSDVIFGALHDDDGVTVAVFTDGRDPGRARATRDSIADWLRAGGLTAVDGRRTAPGSAGDRKTSVGRTGISAPVAPDDADTLLVLVAHGSRNPEWGVPLEALTAAIADAAGTERVRLAYSQFSSPSLETVVADAATDGLTRIRVLPLFMTAHGHVERDIRPVVDALRRTHETVGIELLPPVGELASFKKILVDLAREVTR